MTTLYMPGEKVPLKIDNITVSVSQLTMAQKATVIEKLQNATSALSLIEAAQLAVKFGVKSVEGVSLSDGSPFKVSLEGNVLTDESVEALLCLPQSDKIQGACFGLLKGLSNPLVGSDGKPIPGVEVVANSKPRKQAKN